jgi:hypothetical protein
MKKPMLVIPVILAIFLVFFSSRTSRNGVVQEEGFGGGEGFCPFCGRPMDGPDTGPAIPLELPMPEDRAWVESLREAYALEKLSKRQYDQDSAKYHTRMPYHVIIPQERAHILWIERLFSAYGLSLDTRVPPIRQTSDILEALQLGYSLEEELVPRYEWLMSHAHDKASARILDQILLQTRMHAAMFGHAIRMGSMGFMGPGMMRRQERKLHPGGGRLSGAPLDLRGYTQGGMYG